MINSRTLKHWNNETLNAVNFCINISNVIVGLLSQGVPWACVVMDSHAIEFESTIEKYVKVG